MMVYPRTDWGTRAALIAVPMVGLLVWIFNSYKLGRIRSRGLAIFAAIAVVAAAVVLAVILK